MSSPTETQPAPELMSHAEYARVLRAALPERAFDPRLRRLVPLTIHIALVLGLAYLASLTGSRLAHVAIGLVIGHSMACITFVAHDLMHGSIIRSRVKRYPLEVFAWTFMYMPASVWRKVHLAHHAHTQTMRDCDRLVIESERSTFTELFKFTYPNSDNPLWNPLTFVHWALYAAGNTGAAYALGLSEKSRDANFVLPYTVGELVLVSFEVLSIAAVHTGIFFLMGGDWLTFLICDLLAFGLGSAIVSFYVYTNHTLRPLLAEPDPVVGTTSVIVPTWVSKLHSHFANHTAHHLFPAMSSDWYPEVERVLKERWPERYNEMPYLKALLGTWKEPAFRPDELVGAKAAPPVLDRAAG